MGTSVDVVVVKRKKRKKKERVFVRGIRSVDLNCT